MENNEQSDSGNNSYDEELQQQENEIKEQLKNQRYETLISINSEITQSKRKPKFFQRENRKKLQVNNKGGNDNIVVEKKSKNKHAPVCRSARIPVKKYEKIKQGRDPRFDELSGLLTLKKFYKNYDFLEQQKQTEITEFSSALEKQKKKKFTDEEKAKLKLAISKNKSDLSNFKAVQTKLKVQEEITQNNKQKILAGKNPYYLKKNELQKEVFKEKFNQLNEEGKLDSYLNEKRKKKDVKLKQAYENLSKQKKVRFE